MNSYLFTLALGVHDRPERWGSVSGYYLSLAHSLERLGHRVVFALSPQIRVRSAFAKHDCRTVADHAALDGLLVAEGFTHAFIWGGRLDADRETRDRLEARGVRVVFSELGWFPQAGTVYFDPHGTNAEVSFNGHPYAECLPAARKEFARRRREFYRRKAGLGFFAAPPQFNIKEPDLSKPILVPLQDESDTNITLASPFKRMADFIDCLALNYPNYRFVVRPHPSAPAANLPRHANVTYQESSVDVYRGMADFGLVVGINSTLLLESAMMNMPVVAFGQGIGTGTGVFHELAADDLPVGLEQVRVDTARAESYLAFLIGQRQLFKQDLRAPRRVRSSYLGDLLDL
jgi:hypothetical protein